jgi:hypothetical protein
MELRLFVTLPTRVADYLCCLIRIRIAFRKRDPDPGVQISQYFLEKYKTKHFRNILFQNGTLIFVQFKIVKKLHRLPKMILNIFCIFWHFEPQDSEPNPQRIRNPASDVQYTARRGKKVRSWSLSIFICQKLLGHIKKKYRLLVKQTDLFLRGIGFAT